ncbi:inactive lysozyme 1A [Episyrphus balteatus]|uniref:inactive lysozyme 1A n=1 Tax=Episyrphus balteatus TaxID=286459 RepID=UPI002485314A|nr:inactive lysozyme 1A [Episyrphus balteatus]
MLKFALGLVVLSIISFEITHGKVFTKCELARELFKQGIPKSELPDWVCMASGESSFNTKATNRNKNKTGDWGIFQINDRYWCKPSENRPSHNICGVSCNDLLQDNIAKSVACARIVKKQQGWEAWNAWKSKCRSNKPSVSECF